MNRIIAPTHYVPKPKDRCVFLAGGITNAPQWQDEISVLLKDTDLVVFDPRRPNYTHEVKEQISWEYMRMRQSNLISFWFPSPAACMITLFELGMWCETGRKDIVVGVDPSYIRRKDVEFQLELANPGIRIVYSLRALANQIKSYFS